MLVWKLIDRLCSEFFNTHSGFRQWAQLLPGFRFVVLSVILIIRSICSTGSCLSCYSAAAAAAACVLPCSISVLSLKPCYKGYAVSAETNWDRCQSETLVLSAVLFLVQGQNNDLKFLKEALSLNTWFTSPYSNGVFHAAHLLLMQICFVAFLALRITSEMLLMINKPPAWHRLKLP